MAKLTSPKIGRGKSAQDQCALSLVSVASASIAKYFCLVALALFFLSSNFAFGDNQARAETRTLKLYYLHTGERASITYKKNGRYIKSGLNKINRFLRDWRRNEPTKMDPHLLDLIWEVYKKSGSRKSIHVISAYRSPKTNNMLRRRGRGVAKKSQHTLGKAMDFYLPDVKLSKLRAIGLKMGVGGVGYYPRSGSPFVHMDTGRVRHWPRMTRKQLVRVFPNGGTLHVPSDGKPLKGYKTALARYKRTGRTSQVVSYANEKSTNKAKNFFKKLVGADDNNKKAGNKPVPKAVKTKPAKPAVKAPPQVVTAPVVKPTPAPPAKAPAPTPAVPVGEPEAPALAPPPTPQMVLAGLPRSAIPIPTQAPRGAAIGAGTAMALITEPAAAEPELPPKISPEQEGPIQLASIPVPSRRPAAPAAQQQLIAALDNKENTNQLENALAYANPQQAPIREIVNAASKAAPAKTAVNNSSVVAFTPDEIYNMRQQANKLAAQANKKPLKVDELEVAEIKPLEPGIKSTLELAYPARKPAASKPGFKIAKLKAKGMVERPVSLDKDVTNSTNTLGKWALSGGESLGSISDMRLPTYGSGVSRKTTDDTIQNGFVQTEQFLSGN